MWDKLGRVLVEPGSSPQAVLFGDQLRIFYVADWGRMSCARAAPDLTFSTSVVEIRGEGSGLKVDPCVIRLPDGRWRLYYTYNPTLEDPGISEADEIHSAISTDGETWLKEEGIRLAGAGVVDPDVVPMKDGGFRMYYTCDVCRVFSARSRDGLHFEREAGVRRDMASVSSVLALADGSCRMFFHSYEERRARLYCCGSSDGLGFPGANQVVLEGGGAGSLDEWGAESPSVVRLPGGDYFMVYASAPAQ